MGVTSPGRRAFLATAMLSPLALRSRAIRAKPKSRVVIAGGGFAGAACALELQRSDPSIDVTLIDPDSRYVTCPMSNAALVGWRSLESITFGREGLQREGVRYVCDRVASVDAETRRVKIQGGAKFDYDRLVVAPGIRLLWNTPIGYDEAAARRLPHAWIAGAQTALLAAQIRAMRDGGVVAISVPAGLMRCPPGPFERASVIAAYLKSHKPKSKVLIFDANNHFPKQDVFEAAWRELYPGMIEWIPSTAGGIVDRVDADKVALYTSHGEHPVDVANVIPPQAPGQIALEAGLCSGHGWCPVDATSFESTQVKDIHVLGDACIAGAMPKSASAARSQAVQCARAIAASLGEKSIPSAHYESVCYSFLNRDRALSIHGAFRPANGEIVQEETASIVQPSPQREAASAESWYRHLVRQSLVG